MIIWSTSNPLFLELMIYGVFMGQKSQLKLHIRLAKLVAHISIKTLISVLPEIQERAVKNYLLL